MLSSCGDDGGVGGGIINCCQQDKDEGETHGVQQA